MNITGHTVEELKDPTGILEGDRYEFILTIEVEEDDELFSENGLFAKVILAVDEKEARVAQYQLFEGVTNKYLEFALEEEEEELIQNYCKQHIV